MPADPGRPHGGHWVTTYSARSCTSRHLRVLREGRGRQRQEPRSSQPCTRLPASLPETGRYRPIPLGRSSPNLGSRNGSLPKPQWGTASHKYQSARGSPATAAARAPTLRASIEGRPAARIAARTARRAKRSATRSEPRRAPAPSRPRRTAPPASSAPSAPPDADLPETVAAGRKGCAAAARVRGQRGAGSGLGASRRGPHPV